MSLKALSKDKYFIVFTRMFILSNDVIGDLKKKGFCDVRVDLETWKNLRETKSETVVLRSICSRKNNQLSLCIESGRVEEREEGKKHLPNTYTVSV